MTTDIRRKLKVDEDCGGWEQSKGCGWDVDGCWVEKDEEPGEAEM
jgi:hypothetical protein